MEKVSKKLVDLDFDSTIEDLYWYCLTKNYDYIKDYQFLKDNCLPVFEVSECYFEDKNSPLLFNDPLKGIKSFSECFDLSSTSEEFIESFKVACASYYGFLLKWRVFPCDYLHEERRAYLNKRVKNEVKILPLDKIKVPILVDIKDSEVKVPDFMEITISSHQYTFKQIEKRLKSFSDELNKRFADTFVYKEKNKNSNFEIVLRSILSFDMILKYQCSLQSEMKFEDFILKKIGKLNKLNNLNKSSTARDFFLMKGANKKVWPKETEFIYKESGFDTSDMNKFRTIRAREFSLALTLVSNPFHLLSIYTNF